MEEKKVDRARAKAKLVSQYKTTFSSPDGRAVLHDLMRGNFLLSTTPFVDGDEFATMRNVGKQEVVKAILHILKIDPGEFLKVVEEQEGNHV